VEITPQDVQEKQFERTKRGLDPQQVGAFLDQVAASLASRDRQIHEARTEIEALGKAVVDVRQNEEAFRLTMMAATDAKNEMLARAAESAKRIEEEARAAAELIIERARSEAKDEVEAVKRDLELLNSERDRVEATLVGSLDGRPSRHEVNGRPPLELVVDQPRHPTHEEDPGLAARVGDLRA